MFPKMAGMIRPHPDLTSAEVAQVYVGATDPTVDHPIREPKGIDKKVIRAGASAHYVVHLGVRAAFDTAETAKHIAN